MGKWPFIKESSIKHSREVVMERIASLQPLNYNQFRWWRTHTDNVKPLGKRAPLKDRIVNGDFEPSSYFWQAQLALHKAKTKVDLHKDDSQTQYEKLRLDLARYRKLMADFQKEEKERYQAIFDAFTSAYKISHQELEDDFLNWSGDLLSFYYKAEGSYRKTPAEVRKRKRLNKPLEEKQ